MPALLLAACGKEHQPAPESAKPIVLVSIAPYEYFTQRIVGENAEVRSIVRPGADIHTFEPTPHQRDSLKEARIWFRIGEPFENKLINLFRNSWRIVDLRNGIDLISTSSCTCCEGPDAQDRHMWLSPKIAQWQVREIANVLIEQFPRHKEAFEANLHSLLLDLVNLDAEIQTALDPMKNQILLVSHPAFGYFCRDYFLQQLSVEFEGKDPQPKYLSNLLHQAKLQLPHVAIAIPRHNNKGAQMIAEELQIPIKMIDPYSRDYFEMMRTLTKWISHQP
jgi:zinc transport system substrate-binding protein